MDSSRYDRSVFVNTTPSIADNRKENNDHYTSYGNLLRTLSPVSSTLVLDSSPQHIDLENTRTLQSSSNKSIPPTVLSQGIHFQSSEILFDFLARTSQREISYLCKGVGCVDQAVQIASSSLYDISTERGTSPITSSYFTLALSAEQLSFQTQAPESLTSIDLTPTLTTSLNKNILHLSPLESNSYIKFKTQRSVKFPVHTSPTYTSNLYLFAQTSADYDLDGVNSKSFTVQISPASTDSKLAAPSFNTAADIPELGEFATASLSPSFSVQRVYHSSLQDTEALHFTPSLKRSESPRSRNSGVESVNSSFQGSNVTNHSINTSYIDTRDHQLKLDTASKYIFQPSSQSHLTKGVISKDELTPHSILSSDIYTNIFVKSEPSSTFLTTSFAVPSATTYKVFVPLVSKTPSITPFFDQKSSSTSLETHLEKSVSLSVKLPFNATMAATNGHLNPTASYLKSQNDFSVASLLQASELPVPTESVMSLSNTIFSMNTLASVSSMAEPSLQSLPSTPSPSHMLPTPTPPLPDFAIEATSVILYHETSLSSQNLDSPPYLPFPTKTVDVYETDAAMEYDSPFMDISPSNVIDNRGKQSASIFIPFGPDHVTKATPPIRVTTPSAGRGSSNTASASGDNSSEIIIGAAVGVFFLAVIVLGTLLCLRWRRRRKSKASSGLQDDLWLGSLGSTSPNQMMSLPSLTSCTQEMSTAVRCENIYTVAFPYTPQQEGQLSLQKGDKLQLVERAGNGWWRGVSMKKGKSGWFPSSFVTASHNDSTEDITDSRNPQHEEEEENPYSIPNNHISSFQIKKTSETNSSQEVQKYPSREATGGFNDVECWVNMAASVSMMSLPCTEMSYNTNVTDFATAVTGHKFRAVYAYKPINHGELALREGELVTCQERDRNGWMLGRKQRSGEQGWFPAVYVDEVSSDDESVSDPEIPDTYELLDSNKQHKADQMWIGIDHEVMCSFSSPVPGDMEISIGETVTVLQTLANGWWFGVKADNHCGWFPGTFVKVIEDTSTPIHSRESFINSKDVAALLLSGIERSNGSPAPKESWLRQPSPLSLNVDAQSKANSIVEKTGSNEHQLRLSSDASIVKSPPWNPSLAVDLRPKRKAPPPPVSARNSGTISEAGSEPASGARRPVRLAPAPPSPSGKSPGGSEKGTHIISGRESSSDMSKQGPPVATKPTLLPGGKRPKLQKISRDRLDEKKLNPMIKPSTRAFMSRPTDASHDIWENRPERRWLESSSSGGINKHHNGNIHSNRASSNLSSCLSSPTHGWPTGSESGDQSSTISPTSLPISRFKREHHLSEGSSTIPDKSCLSRSSSVGSHNSKMTITAHTSVTQSTFTSVSDVSDATLTKLPDAEPGVGQHRTSRVCDYDVNNDADDERKERFVKSSSSLGKTSRQSNNSSRSQSPALFPGAVQSELVLNVQRVNKPFEQPSITQYSSDASDAGSSKGAPTRKGVGIKSRINSGFPDDLPPPPSGLLHLSETADGTIGKKRARRYKTLTSVPPPSVPRLTETNRSFSKPRKQPLSKPPSPLIQSNPYSEQNTEPQATVLEKDSPKTLSATSKANGFEKDPPNEETIIDTNTKQNVCYGNNDSLTEDNNPSVHQNGDGQLPNDDDSSHIEQATTDDCIALKTQASSSNGQNVAPSISINSDCVAHEDSHSHNELENSNELSTSGVLTVAPETYSNDSGLQETSNQGQSESPTPLRGLSTAPRLPVETPARDSLNNLVPGTVSEIVQQINSLSPSKKCTSPSPVLSNSSKSTLGQPNDIDYSINESDSDPLNALSTTSPTTDHMADSGTNECDEQQNMHVANSLKDNETLSEQTLVKLGAECGHFDKSSEA